MNNYIEKWELHPDIPKWIAIWIMDKHVQLILSVSQTYLI